MLLPLTNIPRAYAWGSTTLLAQLQGRAPTGEPEAELWFGAHPAAPSVVADGTGRTLDRWLAEEGGGAALPYLLKLLAVAHPLSIQVHPSKAQAEAGFAREDAAGIPRDAPERSYPDDNHKPELVVALSDAFRALVGLRDVTASRRLLTALGESAGVREVRDRLEEGDASRAVLPATLIPWLLSAAATDAVGDVLRALPDARSEEFAAEFELARSLLQEVPGDPGIVVALLMNHLVLRRGEGVFVPAGMLHAYLGGMGVEVMAASDNVLRGGFTAKHVDVAELARVLDPATGPVEIVRPAVRDHVTGIADYPVPVPDFSLARVRVGPGSPAELHPRGTAIALATAGEVTVAQAGASVSLRPGEAVLITADGMPPTIHGAGEVFLAQPGH
ncbi:MAG TPA: mannose-6-phosphate isomerase, class I [Microbacterium sp.]|nr:mannose-6-phosphate isomerase, class I [Microbacterium sp.]